MVKRINWTENALKEKVEILRYWKNRNKSDLFSKKLNSSFTNAIKCVLTHPSLGRLTEDPEVKNIIVRDYLLYFIETEAAITIVHVWDGRRDPEKMKFKHV